MTEIIQTLEDSNIFHERVTKKFENKTKNKKEDF